MRQKKMIVLAMAGLLGCALTSTAQVTVATNNIVTTGPYVGCDLGSNQPLRLKTVVNYPIDFTTYDVLRARLNGTIAYTIGGFTSQNKDGNLLLSPDVNTFLGAGAPGPYSLLHLAAADNTAQQGSYRDWMRTGITFTGNADQEYVGQKAGETDFTDMVLHWSDNPSKYLKDRMRMIFTSNYNQSATSGATSLEGLEGMRLFPVDNDHVNVGLGDFYAGNLLDPMNVIEPTERLDILNGKLRIRQLPTDAIASTLTKFLVVDDTPGPDFGVVKWRNVPPGTGGSCAWASYTSAIVADNNILTAYNGGYACPQGNRRVGIGTPIPAGKLAVTSKISEGGPVDGVVVNVLNQGGGWSVGVLSTVYTDNSQPAAFQDGMRGVARNGITWNTGVRGQALMLDGAGSSLNTGVFGDANAGSSTVGSNRGGFFGATATSVVSQNYGSRSEGLGGAKVYGAYALSTGQSGTTESRALYAQATGGSYKNYGLEAYSTYASGATNYGVWAKAANGATNWAGWFEGDVMINGNGFLTGMLPITSDGSLKTNVEAITNAPELLGQLLPKTYDFLVDEHPELALPSGPQMGFIAQDVEEVLPQLVKQATIPATYDSTGVQLTASEVIKTLNYIGIIPLLVAGYQQQQATIAQLQDQINNCCAAQGGAAAERSLEQGSTEQENDLQEQRLLIIPNPVADLTTLGYYVPKAGKVSLQVSTSDGKPLATLREELAEAGAYNYSWNTTKLVAGTYFCTFMLDGAVVVKRAVKVK